MSRIIKIEFNRHLTRWTIAGMLVFLLLGTIILQVGIDKHKIDLEHQQEFINTEMKKVLRYINYHQVGIFGFRRLLEPIPLVAAFYNSITLNELLAFIDNGVRLKHMELKVGKSLFEKPFGGSLDLSWYFLIFGSLAISAWGFFALRNIQFLRFLMNFTGKQSVYWGIILARMIWIFLFLAYLRFNRSLFPLPEKGVTTENAVFTLTKGKIFGLIMYCLNMKNQFLNVFYGCFQEFQGKITIDGQNIVVRGKKDFVYIPCPSRIYNATRIRHLLSLAFNVSVPGLDIKKKVFGDLKDLEKARLLMAIAQSIKTGIIILDDFAEGLASDYEYTEIVREIKSADKLIISMSSNNSMFVIPDKSIITLRRGSGYVQDKDLLKRKS